MRQTNKMKVQDNEVLIKKAEYDELKQENNNLKFIVAMLCGAHPMGIPEMNECNETIQSRITNKMKKR